MNNSQAFSPMCMRELASDSIAYWEWRRIAYNVVLALVFCGCALANWARFAQMFGFDAVLSLFVLAVLANVCYCAAYPVDLFAQASAYRQTWRKKRWLLWLLGTVFAATLTYFWSMDEIFDVSRMS